MFRPDIKGKFDNKIRPGWLLVEHQKVVIVNVGLNYAAPCITKDVLEGHFGLPLGESYFLGVTICITRGMVTYFLNKFYGIFRLSNRPFTGIDDLVQPVRIIFLIIWFSKHTHTDFYECSSSFGLIVAEGLFVRGE